MMMMMMDAMCPTHIFIAMRFLCHRAKKPSNFGSQTDIKLGMQQIFANASQNIQHLIKQSAGRRHPTSMMSSALLQIGE
jgi:hypothetical protein